MQFVGLVAGHHRVPGVGTPLVTDDQIELRSQQVDELPFGLIAPLKTNHTGSSHHKLRDLLSRRDLEHDPPQRVRRGRRRSQRKRKSLSPRAQADKPPGNLE
mgnify:CR=1 FL=1